MNEKIDGRSAYAKKLLDPRWQKKRLGVLNRDGWACQGCFDTESTLHVHHRYYQSGKDPWDYPDEWLVTLCENCHEAERETMREMIRLLTREVSLKFLADNVLDLAAGFNALELRYAPDVVASAIGWALGNEAMQELIVGKYFEAKKAMLARGEPKWSQAQPQEATADLPRLELKKA